MKLLILGGTRFLGRALTEAAEAAGHEVSLFNRGQSGPDLYPHLEQFRGDRDGGLAILEDRHWDAVIDTCGYVPRVVRASAELLASRVKHYTFISTISVYANHATIGLDECSPVGTLEDISVEEITEKSYGPLKVLCEQSVDEAMGDRSLHVRAGLIVGPYDPTDRFTYWPYRVSLGGELLAPGNPDQPVQFIDVRDIAEWTIWATERNLAGIFNVTGPDFQIDMARLLETCRQISYSKATFTWVSEKFLLNQGVTPYLDLPLWVPDEYAGFGTVNIDKAIQAGLHFRPLAETIRDTLAWLKCRSADHEWRAGLTQEREAELLKLWHQSEHD